MKLFLIGIGHTRPEQIDVARKLQKNHQISYWVRMNHVFSIDEKEFPDTIFHSYKDALAGKAAPGVDTSHFDPPSAELITALSSYESELLTMMNKWYPEWNVSKRKNFYYDLLTYWSGVLDTYEPDAIVFLEIPHEIYSFVLFALSKHRGIRTLMFENTITYDRLSAYEDYRIGDTKILDGHRHGFKRIEGLEALSPDVREEFERTAKKDEPPQFTDAFYAGYRGLKYRYAQVRAVIRFVRDGSIWERLFNRVGNLFKESLTSEHRRCEQPADLSKSYVYLGLHSQPERTTSPQGGVYVDQILLAQTIAAALPDGWLLYIKEHPAQWALSQRKYTAYRYRGYYEEIARIPRTRLVPITTNTFALMRSAKAVATVTGTVGWEAVVRSIPALIFGYAWYRYCDGVLRITSTNDVREAFKKIQSGYSVDPQKVLDFVGCLDKATFWSSLNPYVATVDAEEQAMGIDNMYQAIVKHLES
ncbi:MAG TPA: hypothetical protein VMU27_03100 [Candidatus Paceibacterota bacterium]|nr:hypothetical protein [Candidatus Paceibacterota bacterium]